MVKANYENNRSIKHIAEKVKFLRMHDDISVGEMAKELHFTKARITFLETGANRVEIQDVIRYCDFFGLDYEGFLFDDFPAFKSAYLADEAKCLKTIGYGA